MLNALKKLVLRDVRAEIVKWARWGIAHEPQIHYSMTSTRSSWLHSTYAATLPLTTDCSGKFTFNYFMAGAPDPNGLDYEVLGFTGTLMGHGRQITRAEVLPGDGVIWGDYPGVHVATALDAGAHTLESHGQESGPNEISFDAENAYHAARGHHATFWRFPTTVKEQATHVPAGFVQPHPAPKPNGAPARRAPAAPKKTTAKRAPAKKAAPKIRYYTTRSAAIRQGVKLKTGQTFGFTRGKGYYVKAKPAPKKR